MWGDDVTVSFCSRLYWFHSVLRIAVDLLKSRCSCKHTGKDSGAQQDIFSPMQFNTFPWLFSKANYGY